MSNDDHYSVPQYEKDPRWTSIDTYAASHLHPPSRSNHAGLTHAIENSKVNNLPDIACYPGQGKFLALQARAMGAKHILEIGTLGAYSTIWLTSVGPDVRITTIEVSEKHAAVARDNLEAAGVSDQVELLVGNALEVLPKILDEVETGKRERFTFVFIDADKEFGWEYFDWSVKMCRKQACIIVDNVVRKGQLADAGDKDTRVVGSRRVVENAGKDARVDAVVLQTVGEKNYDGFLMAVVQ
ncbi:hypothetical protein MMC12_006799 [Toensbergia leucococca]|nr:hypothetical protein [Toensbergia leucococca]